ncbi:MAG: NADH-quinone oxidoreductase subunit J [Pseudomonadota bacterium]
MSNLVHQVILYAFMAMAVGLAFMVVINRNPVRSILCLVLTFFATAAVWIMLQAEFLGLILVIIYVGAVMTLFLFVIMMLDLKAIMRHKSLVRAWPIALLLVAGVFAGLVSFLGPWHFNNRLFPAIAAKAADYNSTQTLGMVLFSKYLLPFELAGVLLLVGMIAAIALTKREGLRRRDQKASEQIAVKAKHRLRVVKDEELTK